MRKSNFDIVASFKKTKSTVVALEQVYKSYGSGKNAKHVLKGVSLILDERVNSIGILGGRHSGKTTLLNILAGTLAADDGRVIRRPRLSWHFSWRGFGGQMTAEEQICLLARMYQFDRRDLLRFVAEISHLDSKLYAPTKSYSGHEMNRFLLAIAAALDCDLYLLDGAVPSVEEAHAQRYKAILKKRFSQSIVIFTATDSTAISEYCHLAHVLHGGQLSQRMQLSDAQAALASFAAKEGGAN